MINVIYIIIIVVSIVLLLNLLKLYINLENFESNASKKSSDAFSNIGDVMTNLYDRKQDETILDSLDKSISSGYSEVNKISHDKIIISDDLLDEYINKMILSEKSNPNKIFEEDKQEILPLLKNSSDVNKYNSKLKSIIDSKKLKQDYMILMLTNTIKLLLNSLETTDILREKLDSVK